MKVKTSNLVALSTYSMLSMVLPYVIILGFFILSVLTNKQTIKKIISDFSPYFIFLLLLIIYSVYLGNENSMIFHHARDFFIFGFSAIFLTACSQNLKDGADIIYRCIKNMFVFIGILKIGTLFFAFYFNVSAYTIHSFFTQSLGIAMMTTDTENQYLFRLNFAFDSALPFLLFFLIKEISCRKSLFLYFSLIVILFSLLISMSRLLWAIGLLLAFLAFCFEFNLGKKVKALFCALTATIFVLFTTDVYQYVSDIVSVRFSRFGSSDNYNSDLIRIIQNELIYTSFIDKPFFGNGIGYFIPSFIRDDVDKYLYESQSFSLLMDLGIIGFIGFILLVFLWVLKYNLIQTKSLIYASIFFSIWLFSGSFNPFLLGSSGAMVIFFAINANKIFATIEKV